MELNLDSDGYLVDLGDWSPVVAQSLADDAGIELTDDHWRVVEVVRSFYRETGVSPAMRPLVKLMREAQGAELASSLVLMRLFPGNPAKAVARIAGLPKPTNCL